MWLLITSNSHISLSLYVSYTKDAHITWHLSNLTVLQQCRWEMMKRSGSHIDRGQWWSHVLWYHPMRRTQHFVNNYRLLNGSNSPGLIDFKKFGMMWENALWAALLQSSRLAEYLLKESLVDWLWFGDVFSILRANFGMEDRFPSVAHLQFPGLCSLLLRGMWAVMCWEKQ